jgi:hypothetical protein
MRTTSYSGRLKFPETCGESKQEGFMSQLTTISLIVLLRNIFFRRSMDKVGCKAHVTYDNKLDHFVMKEFFVKQRHNLSKELNEV